MNRKVWHFLSKLKALVRDNVELPRNEKFHCKKGKVQNFKLGEPRNSNRIGTQLGKREWIENVGKSEKLGRGMRQRIEGRRKEIG